MAVKKRSRHRTTPDYKDFVHTEPGTLNGKYMRLFWQPVYRSKDLARAHPKPIRIMSEDFTLYRGEEGAPHVVAFRCAHRGTQLSAGWVEGDCLRCVCITAGNTMVRASASNNRPKRSPSRKRFGSEAARRR